MEAAVSNARFAVTGLPGLDGKEGERIKFNYSA